MPAPSRRGSRGRRSPPRSRPTRRADGRTAPSCRSTGTLAARDRRAPARSRVPRPGRRSAWTRRGRSRSRSRRRRRRRRRARSSPRGPLPSRPRAAGPCDGVRGRPVAEERRHTVSAPRARATSAASRTRNAAPSPMTNPSRPASNGRAACPGSSFRPADSARMMSNAPNASGLSGISQPPAIAASIAAVAQVAERLAERDRAGRARVRGREDRAVDVRARSRGWPAPRRRRPRARGSAPPRGSRDRGTWCAAPRRRRCRRAPSRGRSPTRSAAAAPARPGSRPGVLEREPAGHEAELAEPVELAGGLRRHPGDRIEVVDLGRDLGAERRGVEAVDPLARPDRAARRPARNASTPVPTAVMTPMPVIQTSRRSGIGRLRSGRPVRASARALNVASVRPAIGRVKTRSTNHANPGRRGAKSCSIVTCVPAPRGSIRHVTSIPFVAPATWTKRSRRRPGSDHVLARQTTGMPRPRTGTNVRRAMKSTVTASAVRGAGRPRPDVVRKEPVPARDVPRQLEDERPAAHRCRSRSSLCMSGRQQCGEEPRIQDAGRPR